jgi:hypothetical protein
MRALILAGLALSSVLIIPPQAEAMGGEAQWCRLVRDGERGGGECIFYSFAQCAMSSERLNGGGCYENPYHRGGSTPAAGRGTEGKVSYHQVLRHKRHYSEASR